MYLFLSDWGRSQCSGTVSSNITIFNRKNLIWYGSLSYRFIDSDYSFYGKSQFLVRNFFLFHIIFFPFYYNGIFWFISFHNCIISGQMITSTLLFFALFFLKYLNLFSLPIVLLYFQKISSSWVFLYSYIALVSWQCYMIVRTLLDISRIQFWYLIRQSIYFLDFGNLAHFL